MHLYHLTLQRPTAITMCVHGNFSGVKGVVEIIVARGTTLELLRPDERGKVDLILSVQVFGVVRSLIPFRLTGGQKDYIFVGSDSGKITILEFNPAKVTFDKVHQETFGKTGSRRIIPGQYLGVDPKGRAVMIGAVEKQKLVYILNRDAQARLTISSPLEAHKAHTIVYSLVGVDVGFDNPIFACLEVDYEEGEDDEETVTDDSLLGRTKVLTYYELDLGLNHVVRKWSDSVDRTSNILVTIPGGNDGPGGVLICAENSITWRNKDQPARTAPLPRRQGMDPSRGLLIVSHATHKQKGGFFIVVQSEYGDLYKVTLKYENDIVHEVQVKYFDTLPVANSLCVLRTGFLFSASEFANHGFYQFCGDEEEPDTSSSMDLPPGEFVYFVPHALKNLQLVDELLSLSPIIDISVLNAQETPVIYALCGRGPRSSLRTLRHGMPVSEIAVSSLPGTPSAVWTVKRGSRDEFDRYMVFSFVNSTLVLAVGKTVEEVNDSGFLGSTSTLTVSSIGIDSMIQVHPNGIRHIRSDGRINEWRSPGRRIIAHAAANEYQVAIALAGIEGEVYYFELDSSGALIEVERRETGREISCLSIAPVSKGRVRGRFLAVGDAVAVRILSLDQGSTLNNVAMLALNAPPESLAIVDMESGYNAGGTAIFSLYLHVGLKNGIMIRAVLDASTGDLTDSRSRFLGVRPVRLVTIKQRGATALLALSSRSWLCHDYQGRFTMVPLTYIALDHASLFNSEEVTEGVIATNANNLRIITLERIGETFNQEIVPLKYTPRKMVSHPIIPYVIAITMGDRGAYNSQDKPKLMVKKEEPDVEKDKDQGDVYWGIEAEDEKTFGALKAPSKKWASALQIVNLANRSQTIEFVEFLENESVVSITTCSFHDKDPFDVFLIVGTVKDLVLRPKSISGGYIYVFKWMDDGRKIELIHKTEVDQIPGALCGFQGRLLAGMGKVLRIYDLGKRKLLRKCEQKGFPNQIITIHTEGDRIICGDIIESFHYLRYNKHQNALYLFADDTVPRYLTSAVLLDYNTMAGTDKFGNFFVTRLPETVTPDMEEEVPSGPRAHVFLNGAPNKLAHIAGIYLGDTVLSLSKGKLSGGSEVLLFATLLGSLGALIPFQTRDDVDFFMHLEMHMRQEVSSLCGRDHMNYRSSFFPVKGVIDGDLCEQFTLLPPTKQKQIATELERTPSEVAKKLEDFRHTRLL